MGFTLCRFTWLGFEIHLITAVSVIKRLSLYVFTLLGWDLVSIVCIRESHYYRGLFKEKYNYEKFVGTLETVRTREVSLPRGSTLQAGFNSARRMKSKLWTQNQLTNRMHNCQKNTNLFGNVQNVIFHLRLMEWSVFTLRLVVPNPK